MIGHTIFDHGALERLPELVAGRGAQRVLLVCGRHSFAASGADRVLPKLEQVAEVTRFSDFRPNTDAEDLAVGLRVLAEADPDLVLAVGGGTAMDLAKLLAAYDGLEPAHLFDQIRRGESIASRRRDLVLVPTTSGSGAEATHFAVVYIGDDKHSIAGSALYPDAVVLDPQLSLSGSQQQRASSGVDAIAQAIESLWATGANAQSRGHASAALQLLLPALETYVTIKQPSAQLAADVTRGAHLAGRAIDTSRTTAAHALSYGLTKGYGLPHGHAVGVTLGSFIAVHATADQSRLRPDIPPGSHEAAMAEILEQLGARDGPDAHYRFDELLRAVGLTPGLAAHGVDTPDARAALARGINVERLGNNPVSFDRRQLEELLESCG